MLNEQEGLDVIVLNEAGYQESLFGISLNKFQPTVNMPRVATRLAESTEGSHRKFLRQISVWLEIEAPAYWYAEMDTYRIGVTRNSSSTMHKPAEHITLIKGCTDKTKAAFLDARRMYLDCLITIQEYKANIPMGIVLSSVVAAYQLPPMIDRSH
jgi:hypothetical protein